MSSETRRADPLPGAPLARTAVALRRALSARGGRAAFAGVGLAYLAGYLVAVGHLGPGTGAVEASTVADPFARATVRTGPASWEPVAVLRLGVADLLVSPLNLFVGSVLAALVAANLTLSVAAWRGPKACRVGAPAGALAGVPALLSGAVCCGPAVLLVVGVQATGGLLTAFQWALPVGVALLVGTLLYLGTRVGADAAGRESPAP